MPTPRSPRAEAIHQALIDWAADLDLPVTVRQLGGLADQLALRVQCVEPWRVPAGASPKPRSGPDAAREIARRIEASFARPASGP